VDLDRLLPALIVVGVMLLVAFPIHEFSHALAAYRLGDGTAKLFGRLTLNPAVHFDPLGGTLLAITVIASALSGSFFGFGWAKPTPVNPANLEGGRTGDAIVALAGPLSNLILAIAGALPLRYLLDHPDLLDQTGYLGPILSIFVQLNIILMLFNLVPIPPLDGSRVLFALLNPRTSWQARAFLEQYGFLILIVTFFFPPNAPIAGQVLGPLLRTIYGLLVGG
jgi:Zn-dependent protease